MLLGGSLCLDFCNTVEKRSTEHPHHFLLDVNDLLDWMSVAHMLSEAERAYYAQLPAAKADALFEEAIELREALYCIFYAVKDRQDAPVNALHVLNQVLRSAHLHRELSQGEVGFTWKWTDQHLLWPIAISAAELLTSPLLDRLKQCPSCQWMFLDQSKNRSRNWCSMEYCGNRAKARRHYQRLKQEDAFER